MSDPDLGTGAAIARIVDEHAVQAVLLRYATALDTRDWGKLRSCFVPDVVASYDSIGNQQGYEAVERLCRTALEPLAATQHIVSNVEVSIDGDRAVARCNLQSTHVRSAPAGDDFVVAGVYTDELVRTADGWRISRRSLRRVWTTGRLHDPAAVLRGDER
jgi:3-phenylpropionate/cinnamic acid dioxygenase small subunit